MDALKNIYLDFPKKEITVLLGPNGAGKTTLLKILSTLVLPDSGKAIICGYDLVKNPDKIKTKISLLLGGEKGFYLHLTGQQNLEFFGTLFNIFQPKLKIRIAELNDIFKIDNLDKPFQDYSCGMKQRLSLMRALLPDPEIIFMDEPTKSLDPVSARETRLLIKQKLISQLGKTIILATHNTKEAEEIADNVAIIDGGRLKASGKIVDIRKKFGLQQNCSLEEVYFKVIGEKIAL